MKNQEAGCEESRPQITQAELYDAIRKLSDKMFHRLAEKGWGSFASRHEILGTIAEEFGELTDAVRCGPSSCVRDELLDIAVGALFGVACIDADKVDW